MDQKLRNIQPSECSGHSLHCLLSHTAHMRSVMTIRALRTDSTVLVSCVYKEQSLLSAVLITVGVAIVVVSEVSRC